MKRVARTDRLRGAELLLLYPALLSLPLRGLCSGVKDLDFEL